MQRSGQLIRKIADEFSELEVQVYGSDDMMKPPSPKKRLIVHTTDAVKQTVAQALLSDDAACATLLESLVGFEKEVVDALVLLFKTFAASKLNLGGPLSKLLRKYFALIGVETAVARFKEFCNNILSLSEPEYVSNFVFVLCQLIVFFNTLRYEKMRREISVGLPAVIKTLWKNNMRSEACKTARLFVELLLCMSCYQEEECSATWFEHVDIKRFPYFDALSILLNSSKFRQSTDIISLHALEELSSHKEQHAFLRSQMADLILSHFSSFCSRCPKEQLQVFVDYILEHGLQTNSIYWILDRLKKAVATLSDDSLPLQLTRDSIIRLFCEKLLIDRRKSSKDKIKACFSHDYLLSLEFHEELEERSTAKTTDKVIVISNNKLNQEWVVQADTSVRSLIAHFCNIPTQSITELQSQQYIAVAVMFASVIKYTDVKLFGTCVRFVGALSRKIGSLPSHSHILHFLFKDWMPFLKEMPNVAIIREDVTNCLATVAASFGGKTSKGGLVRFSPALDFINDAETDIWTWGQVIRLSVLFESTRWDDLMQNNGKELNELLEKIHVILTRMLSNIAWKDNNAVRVFSDRWFVVYSCWNSIPRNIRLSTMKKLLNVKDMKILKKLTVYVVGGKAEADKLLTESAVDFHLRYFPMLYEDAQCLEDILEWKSLMQLHRASISLNMLLEQLSVKKILEFLDICITCNDNRQESLAIAEVLLAPKLKTVGSDALVLVGRMFEKFATSPEDNMRLLPFAAKSLEVLGHTDVEREVVSLCFSLVSVLQLGDCGFTNIRNILRVLENAIRYAHPSVNNDQCSVFTELLIKVFKAVQSFIVNRSGSAEEVDELVHSLNSLSNALVKHKIYYSRIVGAVLSAVMCSIEELEFAMYKLHSICDKHSTSMLATNLPPSERLKYKRIFMTVRRTRKLVT